MAESVVTAAVTKSWADSAYHVLGTLAIGASPGTYTTGGIALNLNQSSIKASRTPLQVKVKGIAGYDYEVVLGSDNSNAKLIIRAQTSGAAAGDPLGELAASAMPAGVSGDSIVFDALYKGME